MDLFSIADIVVRVVESLVYYVEFSRRFDIITASVSSSAEVVVGAPSTSTIGRHQPRQQHHQLSLEIYCLLVVTDCSVALVSRLSSSEWQTIYLFDLGINNCLQALL